MSEEGSFDIATKSIYWMIAGFVILMLILVFTVLMINYKSKLLHVPEEQQAQFISLRFMNIPECFAYGDSRSERVYPGVIDLSKFTQEQMKRCYPVPEEEGYKEINFELELRNMGRKIKSSDHYKIASFQLDVPVLVKDGEAYSSDTLIIKTQTELFRRPE
ncbi:hypothetical protein HYX13_02330 [Candidatus Woesearchaeota archaeon]|nr:hypothetical protein [Candidatus Woesearchaeota archaeon]